MWAGNIVGAFTGASCAPWRSNESPNRQAGNTAATPGTLANPESVADGGGSSHDWRVYEEAKSRRGIAVEPQDTPAKVDTCTQ
jgi:hypothetical protein